MPKIFADEGMWLLPYIEKLNIGTMQSLGCKLSAEDIYSLNQSSIKDAIVIFGRGCTGEIVSQEGLIFTNHHCGYESIQKHSSVMHDYLRDGFWAMSREEELPTPDLTVTFLRSIEDVTERVLSVVDENMDEPTREELIDSISNVIIRENSLNSKYITYEVKDYFYGNQYFLLGYEVFHDVRMVGAPPSSIGKFGDETDNWTWPRHTGDFSIFRVYADKDNNPAQYSPENVPYQPKHFLPISLKGVAKDDFTFIMGFPGSTERYLTSAEVKSLLEVSLPIRATVRGEKQEVMKYFMDESQEVSIKYAAKYSQSSNYWKYSIGQMKGIKRWRLIEEKLKEEKEFVEWLEKNPDKKLLYGDALKMINEAIPVQDKYLRLQMYLEEELFSGMESTIASLSLNGIVGFFSKNGNDLEQWKREGIGERFKAHFREFYKDYDKSLDVAVSVAMLRNFHRDAEYLPNFYKEIVKKYKNDYRKFFTTAYNKSLIGDSARLMAFLDKPNLKTLKNDPLLRMAYDIRELYFDAYYSDENQDAIEKISKGHRLYSKALTEMRSDKVFYPDANFTMRLTYGTVQDYTPYDAGHYDYITTLQGVLEKYDPDNDEFHVPSRLIELYNARDFGDYALSDGRMPVCFTSTNDITGGNSGSPIMNAEGHLIGLAFDGNWEAMSGDIVFAKDVQRTINVDVRYVLFIIDKFAGASHLLKEMTIIK